MNKTTLITMTNFSVRTISFVLVILILYSCRHDCDQSYKDFKEYNVSATPRQKSWFPRLLSDDCFDIKVLHYLDDKDTTNYAFGVFSYNNSQKMASALADTINEKVNTDQVDNCLKNISSSEIPIWFITNEKIKSCDTYKNENFFLIDNKADKQIFFVYDGS